MPFKVEVKRYQIIQPLAPEQQLPNEEFYLHDQKLFAGDKVIVDSVGHGSYGVAMVISDAVFVIPSDGRWIVSKVDDAAYLTRNNHLKKAEEITKLRNEAAILNQRMIKIQQQLLELERDR